MPPPSAAKPPTPCSTAPSLCSPSYPGVRENPASAPTPCNRPATLLPPWCSPNLVSRLNPPHPLIHHPRRARRSFLLPCPAGKPPPPSSAGEHSPVPVTRLNPPLHPPFSSLRPPSTDHTNNHRPRSPPLPRLPPGKPKTRRTPPTLRLPDKLASWQVGKRPPYNAGEPPHVTFTPHTPLACSPPDLTHYARALAGTRSAAKPPTPCSTVSWPATTHHPLYHLHQPPRAFAGLPRGKQTPPPWAVRRPPRLLVHRACPR